LEFDHSIVVIGLKKLHEDLSSLSHERPLLLFHPGVQQAVTTVGVADPSSMRQRCHRRNRREVTHGQYALLRYLHCGRGSAGDSVEEIANLEV
jgi:hypothetical protein